LETQRSGGDQPELFKRPTRDEALRQLAVLRENLFDLERELIGVGHNRPPEPLTTEGPDRSDFSRAHEDVRALEVELAKESPDQGTVSERSGNLLTFGLKVALWIGARATKFTDVSLAILAPVVVAKATNLFPVLEAAISSVLRAVLH
jgi:hypothetical protein